jgi:hypothetical protein
LLRADTAGEIAPVDVPEAVARVFAVAAITESERDALGTVFFAATGGAPPVVVLDWRIELLEQATLDEYFPAVAARLKELVGLAGCSSPLAPLIVEPSGLGVLLQEQGRKRGFSVTPLADKELLAKDLPVRVVEVGDYLASGAIKLARPAHEKVCTFKGVHRNHLTGDLAAFRLGDEKVKVGPLLAAFATGALDTLRRKHGLDVWAALARSTPFESGGRLWGVVPTSPAPARTATGEGHDPWAELTPMQRRHHPGYCKMLREQNEARVERENAALREATREKNRRMGITADADELRLGRRR